MKYINIKLHILRKKIV